MVKQYGVDKHLLLKHDVLSAVWSEDIHQWVVKVKNLATGDVFTDTAHFFITAAGRLNVPKYPNILGLEEAFKGPVIHPAQWTEELTHALDGKRVAIIGNGASGQQLLVNIFDKVAHIDHYVRSRQWIVPSFSPNLLSARRDVLGAHLFTEEEKKKFEQDPKAYLEYRRSLEKNFHGRYGGSVSGSAENDKIREAYENALWEKVDGDKTWFDRLVPAFAPGCKRPTPSAGYVEAIRSAKVDYVDNAEVTHSTADGLVTADGRERKVDIIITATGFKSGFLPLFPTIGKEGLDLSKHWAENGPLGYPQTYFGLMAPNIPNYFGVIQVRTSYMHTTTICSCTMYCIWIGKRANRSFRRTVMVLAVAIPSKLRYLQHISQKSFAKCREKATSPFIHHKPRPTTSTRSSPAILTTRSLATTAMDGGRAGSESRVRSLCGLARGITASTSYESLAGKTLCLNEAKKDGAIGLRTSATGGLSGKRMRMKRC